MEPALRISGLTAGYGGAPVIADIDLRVQHGSTVSIVGPNGAGKTTLARTIGGFTDVTGGEIRFEGRDITGMGTRQRTRAGIVHVPEGRRLFPQMSVLENLQVAFFPRRRSLSASERDVLLDDAFQHFPVLGHRKSQPAGTLSGGEQQMLAIARALLLEPKVLVLDEPSTGLAPVVRHEIFEVLVSRLEETGCACLLIEQRALDALQISAYGYILERGRVVHEGPAKSILEDPELRRTYVGHAGS